MALEIPVYDEKAFALIAFVPKGQPQYIHGQPGGENYRITGRETGLFPIDPPEAAAGSTLIALRAARSPVIIDVETPHAAISAVLALEDIGWLFDCALYSVHPARVLRQIAQWADLQGKPTRFLETNVTDICESFYRSSVLTFTERKNFSSHFVTQWGGIQPTEDFPGIPLGDSIRVMYSLCKLWQK